MTQPVARPSETTATTSAGYLTLLLSVAVDVYRLPRKAVLDAAALDERELADPGALLPERALWDLMRFMSVRTGDPALGLRLAHALDLRTQGFYGYALLSSTSGRERLEMHRRYDSMRTSVGFSMRVDGELAILEFDAHLVPDDLLVPMLDWGMGTSCIQMRRRLQRRESGFQVWLAYAEQPHHRALRELVGGPVTFDAAAHRLAFPARDLEQQLPGDPHLAKLAMEQLDAQLAAQRQRAVSAPPVLDHGPALLEQVRSRLRAGLARDASIERIASDLGTSPRTLRRRLGNLGSSFQALREEVRHELAIAHLQQSELSVEAVALQLGYGDAANFRRAFRRWQGVSPSAFRAGQRVAPSAVPPRGEAHARSLPPAGCATAESECVRRPLRIVGPGHG